ncbi:coatomer subunit zeta [Starmerella bacillaris]|uniref:Coatomer subunit zeta n=1 Tax=Starmerella bacillaris TaxID=1247836 RepID=A0AAV5RF37_STABA|nr:coatomer subunit zeta [Starmerella bacillaris]
MSLYAVQAVLILDSAGERVLSKYYQTPRASALATSPVAEQRSFEQKLAAKTKGVNDDVLIFDGHLVVYKQLADILVYIVAPLDENEVLIFQTLTTLRDVIDNALNHRVDKSNVLDRYDCVALAVDSVVDNGIILSNDSALTSERLTRSADEELTMPTVDFSETGFKSMFDFAKGRLAQAVRHQLV